jgi:hypothetical protein
VVKVDKSVAKQPPVVDRNTEDYGKIDDSKHAAKR